MKFPRRPQREQRVTVEIGGQEVQGIIRNDPPPILRPDPGEPEYHGNPWWLLVFCAAVAGATLVLLVYGFVRSLS